VAIMTSRACAGVNEMRVEPSGLRTLVPVALVTLAIVFMPCRARTQSDAPAPPPAVHPEFRAVLDVPLLASGATLIGISTGMSITRKYVPPEGLDPNDIHWSVDRKSIGEHRPRADTDSDYFRDLTVAYPMVLAFIYQPSGSRISGTLRRSVVYLEAILIAEGVSRIMKKATDRPRPFCYLPAEERPDGPMYDVTVDEAFQSMPSGHATISFCGAGFAIADHLITRPQASWQERAGISLLGGFLASLTAGMRVDGGQHFPSDTIVGGLIGTASGVAVPLVHRYVGSDGQKAPLPSRRAWLQALAGEAVGIVAGALVAQKY
jgi:membrane-associated phospholipid phosphatase